MLRITCPVCGAEGDETEFAYGHQAHIHRPGPDCTDAEWEEYLFLRENPKGWHAERWLHAFGCGKWFHAVRHTVTMEIAGTYPADAKPPADLKTLLEGAA
ncbi:sarcosine oxidase subunit delta [Futiania mangrovi]|uniref:Sarcosine oxidase subunit delta n=1 Tax=Futiania mangrovi TaxID=2959716 RepID=A0A9J6PCD6_9PROT|nr:sarcosine oxidase subunit delta [Futiania mangrovii]MCP1335918.1 sarcosine oxidase subunit delta [Futiania mangrovii]